MSTTPTPERDAAADGAAAAPEPPVLLVLVGPPAVGKMTVGREIARRTGLRLFHNHVSIEPVLGLFEFGSPSFDRIVGDFRRAVFEEAAKSTLPGLIFTFVCAFDLPDEAATVEAYAAPFRARAGRVLFAELEATLEERLRRNETEPRLAEKPSKRDVHASRRRLLENEARYRLNSHGDYDGRPDWMRIDTTGLSPAEVAERIVTRFRLPQRPAGAHHGMSATGDDGGTATRTTGTPLDSITTARATSMTEAPYPITDLDLARRLEGAEAAANVAFIEARARLDPAAGAAHLRVAGVSAMFDGPESPLTQTFGLGLNGVLGAEDYDALEAFFLDRSAPVHHEVSPLASPDTLVQLTDRGYHPVELSTVLVRPTSLPVAGRPTIAVRKIGPREEGLWSRTAGEGWSSESPELADFTEAFGAVMARAEGVHCFLAELDGRAVAAGAMVLAGDVALLAGASTIPAARGRGAQTALLAARLEYAGSRGAGLAMLVAQPGSASQRNAERQGFRTVYTRTKWRLGRGGT